MSEPTLKLVIDFPADLKLALEAEKRRTGKSIKQIIIEALTMYGIRAPEETGDK